MKDSTSLVTDSGCDLPRQLLDWFGIALVPWWFSIRNFKAIVNFVDGRAQLLGATRSLERRVRRLPDTLEETVPCECLVAMHTRNEKLPGDRADRLGERLHFPRDEILVGETGSVVAYHAEAGTVGVFVLARGLEERSTRGCGDSSLTQTVGSTKCLCCILLAPLLSLVSASRFVIVDLPVVACTALVNHKIPAVDLRTSIGYTYARRSQSVRVAPYRSVLSVRLSGVESSVLDKESDL